MAKITEYVYPRNFDEEKGLFDLDNTISKDIEEITDKHFIVRCSPDACKIVLDPGERFTEEEKKKLDKIIEDSRSFK